MDESTVPRTTVRPQLPAAPPVRETPPQHSLRTCIQEAEPFLRDAESELDGTEHPAIYDLLHACKWLLAGLEALEAASKPKGDPP